MLGSYVLITLKVLLALTIMWVVAGFILALVARRNLNADYRRYLAPTLTGLSLISSSAPYIGLLGTVWHIIQALGGIGSGNLNVAAIASPIGDALYATLWGLACAIPAMISHGIIRSLLPEDYFRQSFGEPDQAAQCSAAPAGQGD